MRRILGQVKQYHWGKNADGSLISELIESAGNGSEVSYDRGKPLAEYWLGTHGSGRFRFDDGSFPAEGYKLRFLMKVLCVNQCLSVQVHPEDGDAAVLHRQDPVNYPDDNAKPEVVVALTPFRALCGFRSMEAIANDVARSKTMQRLFGLDEKDLLATFESHKAMKNVIERILRIKEDSIPTEIQQCLSEFDDNHEVCSLIKELSQEYPTDPGLFLAFFLQQHHLQPGECLFVSPGVPHAYLAGGDAIELMLCSDNVIRLALTPKYKDIDNAIRLLRIERVSKLAPLPMSPGFVTYQIPYFRTHLHLRSFSAQSCGTLCPLCVPPSPEGRDSIVLVTRGACRLRTREQDETAKRGQSFLLEGGRTVTIVELTQLPFQLFQAF